MPDQFRSYRSEAVVLRHANLGEADRIVTLYTREQGKLRAIAKGARKIRSRKAGHLEPFTHITVQLAKTRDMPIVTQVETIHGYLPLRDNLSLTGYASYVLELLDRFTFDQEGGNSAMFRLLIETLDRLCEMEDPWVAIRFYEIQLLDFLGFRPHLFECANCRAEIQAVDQFFSPSIGGVICRSCGDGLPGLWKISVDVLKYLRHFQRSSFEQASRAKVAPELRREIEELTQAYFVYLLERSLNTPTFIKRMAV